MIVRLVFSLLLASAYFGAGAVWAADLSPDQERSARRIFSEFFSPFCPGRTIEDCPSSKAGELRAQIRERLSSGSSREDIENYLVSVYGESLLAMPRASGFGQAAWLGPILFGLFGLGLVVLWLRRAKSLGDSPAAAKIDPELQARIEREIDG